MVKAKARRLSRDVWLGAALRMGVAGIDAVKVAPLAQQLGVTTGSFYWHFKDRRELLEALLDYWEQAMTDAAILSARQFEGPPIDRILYLMSAVMTESLGRYDLAIWLWAQSDKRARKVFRRAIKKRFEFAAWMFGEAGFSEEQAAVRGHMMVTYMMGESTLVPESTAKRREHLKLKHAILTAPQKS